MGSGNRARGMEKEKVGTKQRIENKVTDRVRMKVKFYPHFLFSRSPCLFPVPRSPFIKIPPPCSERIL